MKRPFRKLRGPDGDVLWFGANFWSRSGGPLMWRNYDSQLVRQELGVLADHGLTMTRSFFYWPDFHPAPDRIDELLCAHFADFLDAHRECAMTTVPTFIVGHMSGENWDPAWRNGRDIYTDVWMVGRQAWYISSLTRRFADHPSVSGWLISNEIPIYGLEAPTEVVTEWARLMTHAVRAGGGRQPVSIGDGAWGGEVSGHSNGFSVTRLAEFTDFVGPHVYKMETDIVRQHLKAAFVCELADIANLPVVMEEFGVSTDFVSSQNAGHYYRQLLYTTLLAGSVGWIAWNNTDYDDLLTQRPYSHHPFELHFGITTSTGEPKAPLKELAAFKQRIDAIDMVRCDRSEVQAAIVVSSYLAHDYQFTEEIQRNLVVRNTEQAYIAAREADLPVGVIRETKDGGIEPGYRLYLLPSVKELTGPTWAQLGDLAAQGATIYVSYCAGESDFQRGPWWVYTERLFGVTNDLVYGLNNPILDETVTLTFIADLGSINAGETLSFRSAGNVNGRAYLPVQVSDGTVIATDDHGRPAVVIKEHGNGRMVLCTYPLEYLAAAQGTVNPEDTWRLYRALAEVAKVTCPVSVDDPQVMVDSLIHPDGRRFVFLISQHADPVMVAPITDGGTLIDLDGATVNDVSLDPYGVEVLTLTTATT